MYELKGKIQGVSVDYGTGDALLTLRINPKQPALNCYDELRSQEKLSFKIDKFREKRSLDANAYCFVLIGKLAEKLNISKEDIYREAVKQIGGNYEIVCVKDEAVEKLRSGWSHNGLGWQTDTLPSKIDGCTNVILYYGSSTYDTQQMSRLINIIVEDCKEQGIETKTPNEIANLLSLWGDSDVTAN